MSEYTRFPSLSSDWNLHLGEIARKRRRQILTRIGILLTALAGIATVLAISSKRDEDRVKSVSPAVSFALLSAAGVFSKR